ncbi:MAG: Holliday junction resolvase RuvX, partial [Actinomycetia bacterium]|nr:Holliday junction resolvase RuvX [Actinomycetes bacterium]
LIRKTLKEDVKEIQNIVQKHKVDEIIYGIPVNLKGKETKSTRMVKSYVEQLSKEINLPFTKIDERLTTVEAERIIREMKVKRGRKKKVIDKIAACLILQTFLSKMKKNES